MLAVSSVVIGWPVWLAASGYLPGPLHGDGQDVEVVAAELTAPAAALADPLQQAGLVGVAHRAVTAARVQQVALWVKGQRSPRVGVRVQWV